MTFTYDLTSPTDLTRVRYQIQDTDAANPRFQDEDIEFVLSENDNNVARAVLSILRAEQVKLATLPNYQADWLKVERQYQREQLQELIDEKEALAVDSGDVTSGARVIFLDRL